MDIKSRPRMLAEVIADALRPAAFSGAPWLTLVRAMHRVRILVGVTALAVAGLLPGATTKQRILFVVLVAGLYLPYGILLLAFAEHSERPLVRIGTITGDMLIVFAFQAALPQTRLVAIIGYLLLVALYSSIGGLRAGVALTAASVGLTILAQTLKPTGLRLDAFNVSMYAAAACGLALLLETASREQRRALGEFAESRRQLAEAQTLAHIGSWGWDVVTDSVAWSEELYRIYGLTPETFAATAAGFLERVHADDRAMADATFRRSLETGEPFAFDHRINRPDGTVRWLHGRGEVVKDAGGRTISMFGTGQDITDEKRMLEELERLDRAKSEFVANAAHELRTPLATIAGFASTLAKHRHNISEEDLDRSFDVLLRQSDRVGALITNLLDLSQIEGVTLPVELHEVELAGAARRGLESAPPPAGKTVSVEIADGLIALSDPARLDQILINLLTNAYRYGGNQVHVEAVPNGNSVILRVSDDGPGVPPELAPRLFEPFTRGNETVHGSGLGLAIVRRLVNALDGEVSYEPVDPHGACFMVRFPKPRAPVDGEQPLNHRRSA